VRVLVRDAERPLVEVELPEEHGTRRSQLPDDGAVLLGHAVAEDARTARRSKAGGVVQILERDGDPVQRAAIDAVREVVVGAFRLGERGLGRERDEGAQLAVVARDPVEACAYEIDR
jgi:hypothetical protein